MADFLGVHLRTVRSWSAAHARDPRTGLKAKPPPGRPRKLTASRERTVPTRFLKRPKSFGFPTELWTARRVAQVIHRTWGVTSNPRY